MECVSCGFHVKIDWGFCKVGMPYQLQQRRPVKAGFSLGFNL